MIRLILSFVLVCAGLALLGCSSPSSPHAVRMRHQPPQSASARHVIPIPTVSEMQTLRDPRSKAVAVGAIERDSRLLPASETPPATAPSLPATRHDRVSSARRGPSQPASSTHSVDPGVASPEGDDGPNLDRLVDNLELAAGLGAGALALWTGLTYALKGLAATDGVRAARDAYSRGEAYLRLGDGLADPTVYVPSVTEADLFRACEEGDWRTLDRTQGWLQPWYDFVRFHAGAQHPHFVGQDLYDLRGAMLDELIQKRRSPLTERALTNVVQTLGTVFTQGGLQAGLYGAEGFRALLRACTASAYLGGVGSGQDLQLVEARAQGIAAARAEWVALITEAESTGTLRLGDQRFSVGARDGRLYGDLQMIADAFVSRHAVSVQTAVEMLSWMDPADWPEAVKYRDRLGGAITHGVRVRLHHWLSAGATMPGRLPFGI